MQSYGYSLVDTDSKQESLLQNTTHIDLIKQRLKCAAENRDNLSYIESKINRGRWSRYADLRYILERCKEPTDFVVASYETLVKTAEECFERTLKTNRCYLIDKEFLEQILELGVNAVRYVNTYSKKQDEKTKISTAYQSLREKYDNSAFNSAACYNLGTIRVDENGEIKEELKGEDMTDTLNQAFIATTAENSKIKWISVASEVELGLGTLRFCTLYSDPISKLSDISRRIKEKSMLSEIIPTAIQPVRNNGEIRDNDDVINLIDFIIKAGEINLKTLGSESDSHYFRMCLYFIGLFVNAGMGIALYYLSENSRGGRFPIEYTYGSSLILGLLGTYNTVKFFGSVDYRMECIKVVVKAIEKVLNNENCFRVAISEQETPPVDHLDEKHSEKTNANSNNNSSVSTDALISNSSLFSSSSTSFSSASSKTEMVKIDIASDSTSSNSQSTSTIPSLVMSGSSSSSS